VYPVAAGLAGFSIAGEAVQQQAAQRYLEGRVGATVDPQAAGDPPAFDQPGAPRRDSERKPRAQARSGAPDMTRAFAGQVVKRAPTSIDHDRAVDDTVTG